MNIAGLLHININCSDFERSKAFYELLGFREIMRVTPDGEGDEAAAVGMSRYRVRGALMKHPSRVIIDLLEWQEPRVEAQPYASLAHPGIARVALLSTCLNDDINTLVKAGVTLLSEQPAEVVGTRGSKVRFICFRDPDGTVLELVEMEKRESA